MLDQIKSLLIDQLKVTDASAKEKIQSLWSGYGEIRRWAIQCDGFNSLIVKCIEKKASVLHPRGWNTDHSHKRKLRSYEVEKHWYENYASSLDIVVKVPTCYKVIETETFDLVVLEDLDASGYPRRLNSASIPTVKVVLQWLANFHAYFMQTEPKGLWQEGSYWHLNTRPDEFQKMEEGPLKRHAHELDNKLCNAQFRTLVHGDAKVANFCFNEALNQVAAVDFQYVGGGCGMRDLSYFLGSCLSDEDCFRYEEEMLLHYFNALTKALIKFDKKVNFSDLIAEWSALYSVATADFVRFLKGWMPQHQKINTYSLKMVEKALKVL